MKIYHDQVYTVIEVNAEQFDLIRYHQLHSNKDNIKFLLGHEIEQAYLSEVLDVEPVELAYADYYKIVRI